MTTPNPAERAGQSWGKSLRQVAPRSSHAGWDASINRRDPVEVITSQNEARLEFLVPIRHWRMAQSPFAFYRGGAKLMAFDLEQTPVTGLNAQICGDAHMSNFGVYGSPERELVFDLTDFDETLPGPWEWDVKRLAASFAIAARHNEYDPSQELELAVDAAATYRKAMAKIASMRYLDAWYSHLTVDDIYAAFKDQVTKQTRKSSKKFVRKARSKGSLHSFEKLAERVDGSYRIAARPPLVIPLRDLSTEVGRPEQQRSLVRALFDDYLDTVPDHIKVLLQRFRYSDIALRVGGVGSVGTRCLIVLLEGKDDGDPFFLQIKEATRSVLEGHLPDSVYPHPGQRVVEGQQLMQAASDTFLGWGSSHIGDWHYYWRQLNDMKGSVDVESKAPDAMHRYARLCGWTLARAHARSGNSQAIAGYLGKGDVFDRAIGDFAVGYADQNARDFSAFKAAIDAGRIKAHE